MKVWIGMQEISLFSPTSEAILSIQEQTTGSSYATQLIYKMKILIPFLYFFPLSVTILNAPECMGHGYSILGGLRLNLAQGTCTFVQELQIWPLQCRPLSSSRNISPPITILQAPDLCHLNEYLTRDSNSGFVLSCC